MVHWHRCHARCVSAVDCLDPTCSGHGACHHGECHCNPGWGGISCEILKSTCPEQCSNHGTFSTDSGTCVCDANWTGADCSIGKSVFWSPEDVQGVVCKRPAASSDIYLRVDDFEMVFWTIYGTNGKKKRKKNAQHTLGKSTKCIFPPKQNIYIKEVKSRNICICHEESELYFLSRGGKNNSECLINF